MKVAPDTVVTLEYTVWLGDGRLLDSTAACGPLMVMIGAGQLFPPLEEGMLGMAPGETRDIEIPPEKAYGRWDPDLVRPIPRDRLPPDLQLEVGVEYRLKNPDGRAARFRVLSIGEREIAADFNAPNAGQALHARVTVIAVRAPTADEERRGRVG